MSEAKLKSKLKKCERAVVREKRRKLAMRLLDYLTSGREVTIGMRKLGVVHLSKPNERYQCKIDEGGPPFARHSSTKEDFEKALVAALDGVGAKRGQKFPAPEVAEMIVAFYGQVGCESGANLFAVLKLMRRTARKRAVALAREKRRTT